MNVSPKTTILLAAIVTLTILAVRSIASGSRAPAPQPVLTKQQSAGAVTVAVTPVELTPGKSAVFQVVFDTHSVNLAFDVSQIAELRDEKGMTYGTPTWNGDPPGGHHRRGTLTFPTPLNKTQRILLILNNVAGIPQRTFRWNL